MGIEYKLKTTQLTKCSVDNSTNCCKADDPDSCKNLYQAELDYNKALANVNMIESLIAISHAIDTNHNALRELEQEDLQNAELLVDKFMNNFERANLLNKSLEFIDKEKVGKNIWTNYNGDNIHDLNDYLTDKCNDKDFENFCNEYNRVLDQGQLSDVEVLKTLQNFSKADKTINYDLGDRKNNYENYQEYLKVNVNGKFVDLDQLESTGEIKKIQRLKQQINEYKKSKSKESAKEILKLSQQLQKIKMNFNNQVTLRTSIAESTRNDFERDITNVSTVAGAMLNRNLVKKNLRGTKKSLDIEITNKEGLFLKSFNDNKTIADLCPSATTSEIAIKCVKELCSQQNGTCIQDESNKKLFSIGLQAIYDDAKNLDEAKTILKANEAMQSCMNLEIPTEQHKCLQDNKTKLGAIVKDGLQDAKNDLAKALKTLNYLKVGEPIKQLRLEKYMGLTALEKEKCVDDSDKSTSTELKSYCETPAIDTHLTSAVNLSSDVDSIMVTYNDTRLANLKDTIYKNDNENFNHYYVQLMDDCESGKSIKYLCEYYEGKSNEIKEKKTQAALKAKKEKEKRENAVKTAWESLEYTPKKSSATMSGAGYATAGLVQGVTSNISGLMGYFFQKKQHDRQMEYYQDMYSYQSLMYSENTVHQTNWINWNYDPIDPTSFNSTPVNYLDTSSLSYDFSPIPFSYTTNNASTYISPTTTTTTTPTSTTGYSF